MSRRGFRVPVEDPRPTSAWLLVAVATVTLGITGQLAAWALCAAAAAISLSLWRRTRPFAWQTNPWVLNGLMIAITVGTTLVALSGEPSTIALAHFAATTQGLQLIDARPRRTEFLLVALALFQVVLAANLTDSVFFTPLLVAFVFAAVWTLIVHTLRSEALEAGQARDLPHAITPSLARTTLVTSGLAVLLAMLLFITLPRLQSTVVRGPVLGGALAASGFAERVELGALGKIRSDPRVVMRVETLEGEAPDISAAYWRGLAFDDFDGHAWSITPPGRELVPGSAESGVGLGREPDHYDLVQRIVREPVEGGVLFRVGDPRGVQGTIRRLERDVSGGLYAASQADERIRYTVRSLRVQPDDRELRQDRAALPRRGAGRELARIPLSPEVGALAARIVAGARDDAEKARAIERYLVANGRYTDTPPDPPQDGSSPIEGFLLRGLAGHCEYFASAMVVLAREVGLPARLVNGFAGGRTNEIGGFVVIAESDAHAWVEIRFERAGWVRYDPTPADLRTRAEPALSLSDRLADVASAVELWWFQRVVGFDRSDQIDVLKRAWLAWHGRSSESDPPRAAPELAWRAALDRRDGAIALAAGGGLAAVAVLLWRRRDRSHAAHPCYARALRLLARRGLVRRGGATARGFAREIAEALPAAPAAAFAELTEAYLCERFGARAADGSGALLRFEQALGRKRRREAG
jgi:protein-glutamine gamma-glutamyltransferase